MGFNEENFLPILLLSSSTHKCFSNSGWHHLPANRQGNQCETQEEKLLTNGRHNPEICSHCLSQTVCRVDKKELFATK